MSCSPFGSVCFSKATFGAAVGGAVVAGLGAGLVLSVVGTGVWRFGDARSTSTGGVCAEYDASGAIAAIVRRLSSRRVVRFIARQLTRKCSDWAWVWGG